MTLLARLREEFPDSSGRRLRAWLVAGRVRVRGEIVHDPRTPVAPGDPVTLGPAPPPALAAPLRLVHEDDALLVIEKPSGPPHDRHRARAGAHRLPHGVGLPQGRAALPPAVHRPPAGPGDLGPPGHRQDAGDEAVSPGAVLLGQRGAAVRRDRRGCGDGGRGNAPRRPGGGALAPRPPRRSDPAAAEGPPRAHRDHPVPRGRATGGRDPGGAPARQRAGGIRSGSRWRRSATRSSATPVTARAGTRSGACAFTRPGSASAIPTPGRRSSSTARRRTRSPASGDRRTARRRPGSPPGARHP